MTTSFAACALICAISFAHAQPILPNIGRPATSAEIAAWDIDVRPDFKGLPKGSGSVAKGQQVWEAKCESCHGTFGESNEVFLPIAGGTTKDDMAIGKVANLKRGDYPTRTTLMKLSQLSTLWDYINRAMPWNAPKSLTTEEVYAVSAYILNLGDIVPNDFVLSDANIADVQKRLPNRNGMVTYLPLWKTRQIQQTKGRGDVTNTACMTQCNKTLVIASTLPDHARNSHGNLAEQNRLIGAVRGIDTTKPASAQMLKVVAAPVEANRAALVLTKQNASNTAPVADLAKKYACTACHAPDAKLLGPSHTDVAKKYQGDNDAVAKLMEKVKRGGAGVWGTIPMPAHSHIPESEMRQLVEWSLRAGQ